MSCLAADWQGLMDWDRGRQRGMIATLRYKLLIGKVWSEWAKQAEREKENRRSYSDSEPLSPRSRPLLCSPNQACWGHWTPSRRWARSCMFVCARAGLRAQRGRMGGVCVHKRPLTENKQRRHDDAMAMSTQGSCSTGQTWPTAGCNGGIAHWNKPVWVYIL